MQYEQEKNLVDALMTLLTHKIFQGYEINENDVLFQSCWKI